MVNVYSTKVPIFSKGGSMKGESDKTNILYNTHFYLPTSNTGSNKIPGGALPVE